MWIDAANPMEVPGEPADAYRRRARRLRHRYQHDPVRMHQALSEAARQHDQATFPAASGAPTASTTAPAVHLHLPERMLTNTGAARSFAGAVAAALEEGLLRYSRRQQLLKEAARHGIGRFEANLIIAAIQHQCGTESAQRRHLWQRRLWRQRLRLRRPPPLVIALAVEAILIFSLCWLVG